MKLSFFAVLVLVFVSVQLNAQELVTLEQVVALAIEKNYDIRVAKTLQEAAATDEKFKWGALAPQVTGNGSVLWNTNETETIFANEASNRSGTNKARNLNGNIQLNWVLFDGTKMFATLERLNLLAAQGEFVVKEQMVSTIAVVITNYFNIVKQKQQLKAVLEQMAVNEERVKLAEKKLQVGTGGKPELLQAKVDFNAQRTQVLQQEAIIKQLKEQLNVLVDSQLPNPFDVTDSIEIDLSLKMDELVQDIENSNYALRASKLTAESNRLAARERRAELSPTISFVSAINYTRNDNSGALPPVAPLYNKSSGYNYGFRISVPILNGFIAHRQIQQASISYSRSQLQYNQQKLQVNASLRNAYIDYENAKEILLIEEETLLLAKENVFIALEGFKRGVTTSIELRTAQQSLADAYNRLINARYLAKIAETELLRLNGGLLK